MDNVYGRLQNMLKKFSCDVGASEAHGILFGLLTGPNPYEEGVWLTCLTSNDDISREGLDVDSVAFLDSLADVAVGDVSGAFMLLPEDNVKLSTRVLEFSNWCQGYLFGLGISGVNRENISTEDCLSFLSDLDQFCRIDDDISEDEEGEKALMELQEFVRIGIMTVFDELGPAKIQQPRETEIH